MVLGTILMVISPGMYATSFIVFLHGMISFIVGLVLLMLGLRQKGSLLINDKDWEFKFYNATDINKIEEFIRIVYSLLVPE